MVMASATSPRALGIALLVVLGLAIAAPTQNSAQAPPASVRAPRYGSVTGYLDACSGLGLLPLQSPYATGTVTVLSGKIRWISVAPGRWQKSVPSVTVARASVTPESPFLFLLRPGTYVLRGSYGHGSNVFPTVTIVVDAGRTIEQDIPNQCI